MHLPYKRSQDCCLTVKLEIRLKMTTIVQALLTVTFLLMLLTSLNARVLQQGSHEKSDNSPNNLVSRVEEKMREYLHNNVDRDQLEKEIQPDLLPNDEDARVQATGNMYSPYLFEGDLNIPKKQIEEAYGPGRSSNAWLQGAISDTNRLWPRGEVYYDFDRSVGVNLQLLIRNAIAEYERETCLRFFQVFNTNIRDLIRFADTGTICSSSSVGKQGGIQTITLPVGCQSHRTILHEIGHSIGFWHEQSRPDRDGYLTLLRDNIVPEWIGQFDVRTNVDYQGEHYDYGSVMHYELNAYTRNGLNTLRINNPVEYANQGRPNVGRETSLSQRDTRQIQKMYKCFNPNGKWGVLNVLIQQVTGLPTAGYYYACVALVNKLNNRLEYCTHVNSQISNNPIFNEWLTTRVYPKSYWHYFEIKLYQATVQGVKKVINHQTIWVEAEQHSDSYCVGANICVHFAYLFNY